MKKLITLLRKSVIAFTLFALPVNSIAQAGTLDLTFSGDGIVTSPDGSPNYYGRSIAIQNDGKILVAGGSYNGTIDGFALVRYNTDGSLDSTFDTDGIATTFALTSLGAGTFGGGTYALAIQSDGKIVVTGTVLNGSDNDFAIIRYNNNGSLDNTFNGNGIVTTDVGSNGEVVKSIAIQSDGKIVVAGSINLSTIQFALVRYNTNGSLDNSFDTDGIVTTNFGGDAFGNSVAIQSDGKIVLAGYYDNGINYDFAAARYNTDGSLDNSFDIDGKVTTAIGTMNDHGYSVAIQNDGKVLVAGTSYTGNYEFALVRYNTDGSIDNTFDMDGKVSTPIDADDAKGYSVAVQSDGKIVVGGYGTEIGSQPGIALIRYNVNGSLDNTFSGDGIAKYNAVSTDVGYSIAIQNDGKIVILIGDSYSGTYFALARYNSGAPNGIIENSLENYFTANPNPFFTFTTLSSAIKLVNASLSIHNIYGQQVKQLENLCGQTIKINRNNLSSGIYFATVTQDNKIISRTKLIIAD